MENKDLELFRFCAEEDADNWLKSLYSIEEDFSLDYVKEASRRYFVKNFGENGEYIHMEVPVNEVITLYESIFARKASLFLKEIRKEKEKEEQAKVEIREKMSNRGEVEAAKWFSAINDSSHLDEIDLEAIKIVADITYNSLFPDLMDQTAKNFFTISFINTAKNLLKLL